jgi:prophage antirepressor-like protein
MSDKLVKTLVDLDYQGKTVRVVGTDRDIWFIAKDVCEVMGITWRGAETLDDADIDADWRGVRRQRTPRRNPDGSNGFQMQDVIVIREYAVYQLATLSKRNPVAKAFRRWLFSEVMPSIREKGEYIVKSKAKHLKAGKSEEWADERIEGIERRKGYCDTLKDHGVSGPREYAACTDAINRPILGHPAATAKMVRQLPPKAVLRDHVSIGELIQLKYAEKLATERIDSDDLDGVQKCAQASRLAGEAVAQAMRVALNGDITKPAEGQ